jgi:transcription-repair coupling factor (superfamily II helicase)
MYHKILDEAIQELREGEFKEVLEKVDGKPKPQKLEITASIETDFDARIPENYVNNVAERINLYTQLSALNISEDLDQSMEKIIDRFGKLPKEVSQLFMSIRLKIAAQNIYAEKLKTKGSDVFLYFNNDLGKEFYQEKTFSNIMDMVQLKPDHFSFKQANKHLVLTIKGFGSIQDSLNEIILLAQ